MYQFASSLFSYKVPPEIEKSFMDQYNLWSAPVASQISYSYAAVVLLAVEHWNTRNAAVVPELAELDESCSLYFPEPKYADSLSDGSLSIRLLWEAINKDKEYHPCAVLGPPTEKATFDLRTALAALDIPMLVHFIENDLFSEKESISPTTITMSLSAPGRARAMVQYLQSRQYLNIASWRSNLHQETILAEEIQKIGEELFNLDVAMFVDKPPPAGENEDDYQLDILRQLRDNGFTTIFLTSFRDPYKLPRFAHYLEQLDMLTSDYFYILPPTLVPPSFGNATMSFVIEDLYGEQVPGSPLDKLLVSAGTVVKLKKLDF